MITLSNVFDSSKKIVINREILGINVYNQGFSP